MAFLSNNNIFNKIHNFCFSHFYLEFNTTILLPWRWLFAVMSHVSLAGADWNSISNINHPIGSHCRTEAAWTFSFQRKDQSRTAPLLAWCHGRRKYLYTQQPWYISSILFHLNDGWWMQDQDPTTYSFTRTSSFHHDTLFVLMRRIWNLVPVWPTDCARDAG